jgi:hypothetical protein
VAADGIGDVAGCCRGKIGCGGEYVNAHGFNVLDGTSLDSMARRLVIKWGASGKGAARLDPGVR